ncbi:MAG: hypothetical protein IMY73_02835 [Bacteroidetes bacterium]|nr:hypothetical protein [Bacteroidota bacterium]
MKKKALIILMLLISTSLFAQNKETVNIPETNSKSMEFMSKDDSFIKKEFFDKGNIKGLKCQVLILTDINNQNKIGCLKLETSCNASYGSPANTFIGILDMDEINDCIKSLEYIKDNLLSTSPSIYTEAEFKTRDNLKFGAYYNENKKKWKAYVYTKGSKSHSAEFFNSSNISSLIDVMNNAKIEIEEKIK